MILPGQGIETHLSETDDLVTVIDRQGCVLWLNPTALRFLGLPGSEIQGRSIFDFIHPDDLEQARAAMVPGLGNPPIDWPCRIIGTRNLPQRFRCTTVHPSTPEGPGPCILYARPTAAPETDAATSPKPNVPIEAVLRSSLDGLVMVSLDGTIICASDSMEGLFGWSPRELVGKNIQMIIPKALQAPHTSSLAHHAHTGVSKILDELVEFEVHDRFGKPLQIELSFTRIENQAPEPSLMCGVIRNIGERKRAQARELSMLRSLATIGESASILAHEIKNPITSINLALTAIANLLGVDERAALDDLLLRLRKLETTMQRSLSFARPLDLNCSMVDFGQLMENARQQILPEALYKKVTIDLLVSDSCPSLMGDAGYLEQMLINLLRNSLDVLAPYGQISMTCETETDAVLLTVDDNGPGIPKDQRDAIFKPFVTTKAKGTGIGLALVMKIAEAHGGTISALSSPQGGARFCVRLPNGLRSDL